jgi:hypothetical protein
MDLSTSEGKYTKPATVDIDRRQRQGDFPKQMKRTMELLTVTAA